MKHILVLTLCLLSVIFSSTESAVAQETENTYARCLSWSQDGNKMVFSVRGGSIFVLPDQSTIFLRDAFHAKWSPDGSQLAVSVYPQGVRKSDIAIYTIADKSLRYLTKAIDGYSFPANDTTGAGWGQYYTFPEWSPDGKSILFDFSFMSTDVLLIQSTDKGKTGKVPIARDIYQASWSPDGKTIAATHITQGLKHQLVLMNPKGGNRKILVKDSSKTLTFPAWSPEGKQIAFVRFDQKPMTYLINADGTNEHFVTDGDCPSWSPDGGILAVTRRVDNNEPRREQVIFVNPDGTNERLFTYKAN